MMRSKWLPIAVVVVILIVAPVAWWLASPLFLNRAVDEAFPFVLPDENAIAAMAEAEKLTALDAIMAQVNDPTMMAKLSDEEKTQVEQQVQLLSAAMPEKTMDDAMPTPVADEWQLVAQGTFRDADDFHRGAGQATIFQQGETRILRLEEFTVTNGPDLHVLLVENSNATSAAEMGASVDLGALKGNIGNQNYEIPADIDLGQYSGVMIYCQPFHVVFATATFAE